MQSLKVVADMRSLPLWIPCLVLSLSSLAPSTLAQDKPAPKTAAAQRETVAKPLTEKERKRREDKLRKELETPYKKWLNEDVVYIITDEERQAWKRLATDEEPGVLPTPTRATPPVSPDGKRTAGASTLPSGRRMRSNRTPRAAAMSGPRKRVAALPRPTPSSSGATAGLRASAPTSSSNSWILPCRANTA